MVAMLRPRQAALAREEAGSAGMLGKLGREEVASPKLGREEVASTKLGREEVASPDIISKFSRVAASTAAIEDNRWDHTTLLSTEFCMGGTPGSAGTAAAKL